MKLIKTFVLKLLIVILYLAMLIVFFKIKILEIVNLKELFLVLLGSFFFCISGLLEKENRALCYFLNRFSLGCLWSGIFTSVVLIILLQNKLNISENFFQTLFICFRPFVYGVIFFFLIQPKKKEEVPQEKIQNLSNYYKSKGLSKREIEVAKLAAKGLTNREIAEELFIEVTTVKRHLYVIFEKLEISKREELNKRCF